MSSTENKRDSAELPTNNLSLANTLLGLFMNPTEMEELLETFPMEAVPKGKNIFSEGDNSESLFIMLSGKASLYSAKVSGKKVTVGSWTEGRSANLYSVIRELPYQYSAVASENCEIIKIPWKVLVPLMIRVEKLSNYLRLMTESAFVRNLSKEINDLGLQMNFRIQFLGRLNQSNAPAQSWILQQGNIPQFCFAVVDGAINAYEEDEYGQLNSLWELPKQSWQLWNECQKLNRAQYSYRSLTNVRIYQLSCEDLKILNNQYPEEMTKYNDWVNQATFDRKEDANNDDENRKEVDSVADLFPPLPPQAKISSKYPVIIQYNQMDCGPACLASISKYFGNEIPIQYWREQVSTGLEGTTLFDMAKAAERLGFVCHGIRTEDLVELEKEILPFIAIRKSHYVVVYEIRRKHILIGDPAFGIRKISHKDFTDEFERNILLMKPTETFYDVKVPIKGNQHYWALLKGYGRETALVVACSIVLVMLSLFPPILSQIILDEVLSKKDINLLWFAMGIGVVIVISKALGSWIRSYYLYFITSKFDFKTHSSFIRKMFSLPYSFFSTRHVGDFTRRLSEMERVRIFFTNTVVSILIDFTTLILYGVVLFTYSPVVAVMCFIISPLLVGISMLFSKKLSTAYSNNFQSRSDQESLLTDQIKGICTIKALGAEVASRWRFEERLVKTLRSSYSFNLTSATLLTLSDAYDQTARFAMMGMSAYLGIKGDLSPGQVVALAMLVGFVIDPFNNLAKSWGGIQEIRFILTRLNDIFLAPSEDVIRNRRGLSKVKLRGEIEFQDVWFRYGGDSSEWVLKGINFKIKPGQNVAIVGPSGAGKSTISYLLARIYEPTKGQILIDGRDYREYDTSWLRTQIGLLHQETNLFYGSVAENIAYGTPKFKMSSVTQSAKLADADNFISKKAEEYDYVLSHGGFGLSGGEKQRIALARTIFSKPSILVLDEATSALDGISEKKLLEAIKESFRGLTVLSIAHRYTTVLMSEFALVISDGRIVGFGTHEQLSKKNGVYSKLFGNSRSFAA
jgi:ATP-binding cassette, subfamily B, bacterial HlyB/CyaB